jgi:hypothetical protein
MGYTGAILYSWPPHRIKQFLLKNLTICDYVNSLRLLEQKAKTTNMHTAVKKWHNWD